MLRRKAYQRLCNFAFIKSPPLGFSNGTQASGRRFELEQLTYIRRTAPWQKAFGKARQGLQQRRGRIPFLLHHHRHQVAALCNFNGRLHQISKRQFAKFLTHGSPCAHCTWNRDRVPAALGWVDSIVAIFFVEILRGPCLRCRSRCIQAVQFFAVPQNTKRIRT